MQLEEPFEQVTWYTTQSFIRLLLLGAANKKQNLFVILIIWHTPLITPTEAGNVQFASTSGDEGC